MRKMSRPSVAIFLILIGVIINLVFYFVVGVEFHKAEEFMDICSGILMALFIDWYINDRE